MVFMQSDLRGSILTASLRTASLRTGIPIGAETVAKS
jgi:hypothetical protein